MIHIDNVKPIDIGMMFGIWKVILGGNNVGKLVHTADNLCMEMQTCNNPGSKGITTTVIGSKYDPKAALRFEVTSAGRIRAHCQLELSTRADGFHESHVSAKKFTEAVDKLN